ncbi:MAG: type II toxin-antitoxin system PemK/MazF family toxin, partial [Geminicoccaceae bacterium]
AVVVQSDAVTAAGYGSVVVCPMTPFLTGGEEMRLEVLAGSQTGLVERSEIMIEKIVSLPRQKVRRTIGRLDAANMRAIERALLLLLGIGEPIR